MIWIDWTGFPGLIVNALGVVALVYLVSLNSVYLITSLYAFRALRRYAARIDAHQTEHVIDTAGALPITLIAAAYNESLTCVQATRALLGLRYSEYRVYFINDGSTDDTLERMIEAFKLEPAHLAPTASIPTATIRGVWRSSTHPDLWLIDKANGGKADALNAGLNYCRTPLFGGIDADSLLEPEALSRISRAFLEDDGLVAAGGILRIVNDCEVRSGQVRRIRLPRNLLARFQVLEYLRAFLAGRMGWDALDATLVVSGAFGIFRRTTAVEIGGYDTGTVGEDMELIVRLHRHCRERGGRYRIGYVPDPVAWTECPETLRVLGRQRDRWQRGLIESMWKHRAMLLNPRYGRIGLLAYPYFFFFEMLGPVIEAFGYVTFIVAVLFGNPTPAFLLAFVSAAILYGVALSVGAVALEELSFRRYPRKVDLLHLFGLAVLENFGYRQLNAFWRMRGFVSKLRGTGQWGVMDRKGFSEQTSEPRP